MTVPAATVGSSAETAYAVLGTQALMRLGSAARTVSHLTCAACVAVQPPPLMLRVDAAEDPSMRVGCAAQYRPLSTSVAFAVAPMTVMSLWRWLEVLRQAEGGWPPLSSLAL